MLQASEALALAKAGGGFLGDSYNTSLKESQICWELRFLATLFTSLLTVRATHVIYNYICIISDIDAVNMEFQVCWNLDRKNSEVSSCPSHCFGRSWILHGFVVCPPKGSVDNWMTPKIQSKIQRFIGSSHQWIRPCGLTKSYQTLCDVVMSYGNPNAS